MRTAQLTANIPAFVLTIASLWGGGGGAMNGWAVSDAKRLPLLRAHLMANDFRDNMRLQ